MSQEEVIKGLMCPGCGGSVEVKEGNNVLKCPYCQTALMVMGDIFSGEDGRKPVTKFYVPVFDTPITNIRRLGMEFTKNQPELESIKKDKLTGCRFSSRDAQKLADFIFLSMEAEKLDMLKNITYSLGLSSPRAIGIPFNKTGVSMTDGILGITIS